MSVGIQRERALGFTSDAGLVCAEHGWNACSAGLFCYLQDWVGTCQAALEWVPTSSAFGRLMVGRLEVAAR